ncbi:MAG: polyphosphate kinase 1 [Acidobacteriaceae bacterium]|nr:polyphosphate kinase 1 [Acidobacteriaceae bacterium]
MATARSARRRRAPQSRTAALTTRLDSPELYLNPHLSLLAFQRRVLEEARDPNNPLLERVKFISILGSNMDEFFMVRVAGLWQQIETRTTEISMDGRSPSEQLELIRHEVTSIVREIYQVWREDIIPELKESGIEILELDELNAQQKTAIDDYFRRILYPVLTPLAVDQGRPFPHISNLSLNVAAMVSNGDGVERFARVKVPDSLPQLVPIPSRAGELAFVWIEQVIIANLRMLFPEMEILQADLFHLTRDAELAIQELESDDLLESVQEAVWRRRFRDAVRLQINAGMPQSLLDLLTTNLELDQNDVYRVDGPIDLSRVRALLNIDKSALKDRPFIPWTPQSLAGASGPEIFAAIQQGDILLHHPFDSFQPVVDFLRGAADDPNVLAIKMTLYRVGPNSPLVEALLEASQNGKQVAVMVELKARFDEESNIEWAQKLEREGVHVVYGLPGIKVHAKMAMVVRHEGDAIVRYVHLGTGNYNPSTARLYTDLGLFTANEEIGADVSDLFNFLTGYSAKKSYRKLLVAPHTIRSGLERLIRAEIERHQEHGDGHLIFKMNALEDPGMIRVLYEASQAGVKIDLIVRGVCSLRPGLPGISETIRVVSIVGRFLEHSRIYYFQNGGDELVYVGSADLMPRNLNRRVEVLFPIEDRKLVRRLERILDKYLEDDANARIMRPDGTYIRPTRQHGRKPLSSQTSFLKRREA